MDEASVVDPYGHVADVMSCPARTLTTGLPLEDAIVATTMERYQVSFGFRLDIVSPRGALTCVVSTGRARRGPADRGVLRRVIQNGSRQCAKPRRIHRGGRDVEPAAHLQAARAVASVAGMMLKHKIHRIPVVNDRDVPIGIVTRTDIFEPLLAKSQDLLVNQETRR